MWIPLSQVVLLGMDILSALVSRLQERFRTQVGTGEPVIFKVKTKQNVGDLQNGLIPLPSLSSAQPHGPAGGREGPSSGPGPGPPPQDHGPGRQPTGDHPSPLRSSSLISFTLLLNPLVFPPVRVGADDGGLQAQEQPDPGGSLPLPHLHPQRVGDVVPQLTARLVMTVPAEGVSSVFAGSALRV